MPAPLRKSFVAAVCFTPVGVLCGLFFLSLTSPQTRGNGWAGLPLYAGAATFLTTLVVWSLCAARPGRPGALRGALAGSASGLLAHPVMWYTVICCNWALIELSIRPGPAAGEPLNPVNGLPGALVLSLLSVVFMGWITVPAGALVGALVGGWQGRGANGPARRPAPSGERYRA